MRSKFKWIFTLLVALTMQLSFAQEKTVKGVVTDANGPMPGVNVLVKGTQRGVSTGFDGTYSIKASQGEVLVFSFMGMGDVSRTVGASASISVKMQDDAKQLGEVVVVGYAKQEKKKMIQSVSVVGASKIRDTPIASFADALQGQASGVQVVNSSGVLGSVPVVKIRGVASISANGRPLIVMDGVPLNDALLTSTQGGQSLDPLVDINQNDIESFSVLKDAAATAIYGSRGSNGVILITTKSGKKNQEAKVEVGFTTSMTTATDVMSMMT
ncbi:TonB-dependent receptor plug domain-containing protein, partial [Flavobacterium psychrophilum]|uniref:TonB-dependent receptor plug domain-containing protein n=1 Tax=Flavobacterium psychrophilum TaxID=96345 RepID=UPI0015D50D54